MFDWVRFCFLLFFYRQEERKEKEKRKENSKLPVGHWA
jgi:hypothetical protein